MASDAHKFQVGQILTAKASGKFYKVLWLRSDDHPKLKGEIWYSVVGQCDSSNYGPVRLMRQSALVNAATNAGTP